MKKRSFQRTHKTASFGQMFGVELFEDSRLLRVMMCPLHYDAVDPPSDDPPFPLADVADRTRTNANLVLYWLQQHEADERIFIVDHHRYFHRDSHDPSDGLDLKRTHIHTKAVQGGIDAIDAMVLDCCHFIQTDQHFNLCAPPAVYDFSSAPINVAIDALLKLPWVHTRVAAPDAGVQ